MNEIVDQIKMEIKKEILLYLLKSYIRDLVEKRCYTVNTSGNIIGERVPGRVRIIAIKKTMNI
jgi:hypothetical protein